MKEIEQRAEQGKERQEEMGGVRAGRAWEGRKEWKERRNEWRRNRHEGKRSGGEIKMGGEKSHVKRKEEKGSKQRRKRR